MTLLQLLTVFCFLSFVQSYTSPTSLSLANITFNGIDSSDQSGYSVSSAGDFNNDGFDDILIGARYADPNTVVNAGETYLIFGTNQSLGSQFNLASINGANGIIFNGIDGADEASNSVSSAGDFNNDGFDDILIGAWVANPNGDSDAGETYLIFGNNQSSSSQFNLSSINGTNGIIFNGIDANDYSGSSVSSAGDFNNDGFADILIGALFANPNGNSFAGETYLIFGTNQSVGSQFNLSSINGTNGIIFNGIDDSDRSGISVSSAGDFNNDGFDDILIGAYIADPNGNSQAGETYLIFGTNSISSQFNLSSINGTNGIIFNGIDASDYSGFDDILIGAFSADPYGVSSAGETYLIFGTNQSFGSQFNLSSINGTNGIIFNGIGAFDQSGFSVSSAGDFNNDGFDDILIGAYQANPNSINAADQTYLIFGTNESFSSPFALSSAKGTKGLIFNGIDANDQSGYSISSAGDFNNDGFADILLGALFADPNGNSAAGETYLVLGDPYYGNGQEEEVVSFAIGETLSSLVFCLFVLFFQV